jgi:hypothetical protein
MRPVCGLALGVLALAAGNTAAMAQSAVISARSGLIHYVEGQVYIGDQLVETKYGSFPEVKENQTLRTGEGRVEVLLTPGVFLRLGENSSFRMITNRLIDTRLEFLSGSAVVEAENIGKDNSVTVVYEDASVHPTRKGIYRFDAETSELRVYDGLAEVASGEQNIEVKDGQQISLLTLALKKFDKNDTDALNRWSERRAEYDSMANVGAASTMRSSLYGGYAGDLSMIPGGWYWNSMLGMYGFVPGMGGMFYGAYGFPYFSPFDVDLAFMPGFFYYPGFFGYPYYGGYGGYNYGYPGYGSGSGATGIYNSIIYRSVPLPHQGRGGVGGGLAADRGGYGGYRGASSGAYAPPSSAAPHAGGFGGGGVSAGGGGAHK